MSVLECGHTKVTERAAQRWAVALQKRIINKLKRGCSAVLFWWDRCVFGASDISEECRAVRFPFTYNCIPIWEADFYLIYYYRSLLGCCCSFGGSLCNKPKWTKSSGFRVMVLRPTVTFFYTTSKLQLKYSILWFVFWNMSPHLSLSKLGLSG